MRVKILPLETDSAPKVPVDEVHVVENFNEVLIYTKHLLGSKRINPKEVEL